MQIAASLIIVSAVLGPPLGAATAQDSTGTQTREERRTIRNAREREDEVHRARLRHIDHLRRTEGLHAAALASEGRHYVGFEEIAVDMIAGDLETVAGDADIIIRGTIGANLTRIVPDEHGKETVVLDYAIAVHEVFKGPASLVQHGAVWTLPGGRYEFPDGASVDILTPAFGKPLPGEELVLFLKQDARYGHTMLAFGTQSLFWLHADGSVEAAAPGYPTAQNALGGRRRFLARVAAAAIPATGAPRAQQSRPEQSTRIPQTREERRKVYDARVKQGLREAAKLAGEGYVESVRFDDELDAGSVSLLADISKVIIRGLITSNRTHIVRSEELGYDEPIETIVTDYTVAVFDVYKGDLGLHSRNITVRIPGGRVDFEGGDWAEIRPFGFTWPMDQDEFIWFLRSHNSKDDVYSVTFGRQGLFELKPGGRIMPRANSSSVLARSVKKDYAEFVDELKRVIARQEKRRQR